MKAQHSFRLRLSLWNAGILLLLTASFGVALCWSTQRRTLNTVDDQLRADALRFSERIFFGGPPPGPPPPGDGGFPALPGDAPPPPPPGGSPPRIPFAKPPPLFGARPEAGSRRGFGNGPGFRGPATRLRRPFGAFHSAPPENGGSDDAELQLIGSLQAPRVFTAHGEPVGPPREVLYWPGVTAALAGSEDFSTVVRSSVPLRVLSRPVRDRFGVIGVVQVAREIREYEALWHGQWRVLATLLPLSLLAAAGAALFLTGRALRPVAAVTRAASELSERDLSRRLHVEGQDELSQLALTFNEMLSRLEQAFQREKRFTADASHELRTPLSRIRVTTSEALSGPQTADEYRRALEISDRSAAVMARLLEQLLTLARTDAPPVRSSQVLDFAALVQETAAELLTPELLRSGPTLLVQAEDSSLFVHGDEDQLSRVITNLLENAVRHTPGGGTVTVSAFARDGDVVLTVSDTGEGIAPEHLLHLGERFFRPDAARSRIQGGAGLGLAICRSIVEYHGGTMFFDSTLGEGATVTVTLPSAAAS